MVENVILGVVAIVTWMFASKVKGRRTKRGKKIIFGYLLRAIAIALAVYVVLRLVTPWLWRHAGGNHHWVHNGFVRGAVVLVLVFAIGFAMHTFDPRRKRE